MPEVKAKDKNKIPHQLDLELCTDSKCFRFKGIHKERKSLPKCDNCPWKEEEINVY